MGTAAEMTGSTKLPLATDAVGAKAVARTKRWLALDLLRFLAVIMMVQGHTFYEVIHPDIAGEAWYRWHGYVHGFTAPIFLFSSGMAFGITTLGKWDKHLVWGNTVYKRVERYVVLIGLGFLLQIGVLKLSWLVGLSGAELDRVASINALQHIGLVLLVCEVLPMLVRRREIYLGVVGLALVACVAAGPWAWNADTSTLPAFVASWVNHARGSLFPIVPWGGFILSGILLAAFVEWRRRTGPEGLRQVFLPLAVLGVSLIVVGDRLAHMELSLFPEHNFWKVSPWWFLIRLGAVVGVLALLCLIDWGMQRARATSGGAVRMLQTIGSQTLVLYVAHLVIIYGHFGLPSLHRRFPHTMHLDSAVLLVTLMLVALTGLAWLWERTKTRHPVIFDRVRYGAILVIALLFVLR